MSKEERLGAGGNLRPELIYLLKHAALFLIKGVLSTFAVTFLLSLCSKKPLFFLGLFFLALHFKIFIISLLQMISLASFHPACH